jgi:hypothetical protein
MIKPFEMVNNLFRRFYFMTEITSKELNFISDALTFEGLICKKARMYSHTLTDVDLAECMEKIADEHEKRYATLLGVIGG